MIRTKGVLSEGQAGGEAALIHTFSESPLCLYLDVVRGLAYLRDPESYVGGSRQATGRATHTEQVEGERSDEQRRAGWLCRHRGQSVTPNGPFGEPGDTPS